jgi:C-terminal processing protease CtpA/Prc
MNARAIAVVGAALSALPALPAQGGQLFDRVAEVLAAQLVDRRFRQRELPTLVAALRPAAHATTTAAAEREVVHALLADVPASHLALYSDATYRHLQAELAGDEVPTFGCVLVRWRDEWFVDGVLDGGPAARAGLRRGDRLLAIDGDAPAASARLDWRADDAWLADPPVHGLLVGADPRVVLRIAPAAGDARDVPLRARAWSGLRASRASQCRLRLGVHTFGYVHLWFVFHEHAAALVRDTAARFADDDGLVFDLRGRGGNAGEAQAIVRELARLHERGVPMAFLIDEGTRSAKEVIASEVRTRGLGLLVGERTAGAVLPASFERVADDAWLMLPRSRLDRYSRALEGRGVAPHVAVADPLRFAAGADAIRDEACRALAASLADGAQLRERGDDVADRQLREPPRRRGDY